MLDAKTEYNYQLLKNGDYRIMIESYDNNEFEIFIVWDSSFDDVKFIGVITAENDKELNSKTIELINNFLGI